MKLAILTTLLGLALTCAGYVALANDSTDAEPVTATTRLPSNPFANAREGEWSAYIERITERGHPMRIQIAQWRVLSVEGDRVTTRLDVRETAGGRWLPGRVRVFSAKESPTIEQFFTIPGIRAHLEDVKMSDESLLFETRTFATKRIAFTCRGDDPRDGAARVLAWATPAIPGSGLFGLSIQAKDATSATTIDYELAGFGRGSTATLGRTPDELDMSDIARRER